MFCTCLPSPHKGAKLLNFYDCSSSSLITAPNSWCANLIFSSIRSCQTWGVSLHLAPSAQQQLALPAAFKPQMSDVTGQWFQTHIAGLLQCLYSLSEISPLISICLLADTLWHCFHLIFQWIVSSVMLNWPSFFRRYFQHVFKKKERKKNLQGTNSQSDWWRSFSSTSPDIADICSLIHIPSVLSAWRLSYLRLSEFFHMLQSFTRGPWFINLLLFF